MISPPSYRHSHSGKGFGEYYDALLSGKYDGPAWTRLARPTVISIFERERNRGSKRYLDFACGTGRITEIGSRMFRDATAIDISPDMIEIAKSLNLDCHFLIGDVTTSPNIAAGPFDCVTAFRFFLNAEEDLRHQVLDWLASRMPKGSALIGNVHMNPYSISGFISTLAVRFRSAKVSLMSRQQASQMLARHGFHVEEWHGFRIMPTVSGKPILPTTAQIHADRALSHAGLCRFGVDQVFVARRK